jgi:hypothetical protein
VISHLHSAIPKAITLSTLALHTSFAESAAKESRVSRAGRFLLLGSLRICFEGFGKEMVRMSAKNRKLLVGSPSAWRNSVRPS